MNYALITGASSGLGKEFAIQLSKEYKLILIARRMERLEHLQTELKTECILFNYDLSIESNCYEILERIKPYTIDICINNAGFGKVGKNIDLKEELNMIDVNIKAAHIFTYEMIQRNCKYILNVTSSAGLFPAGPYMASYYATKSYMTSLTRALVYENKDLYIGCLCPGPVKTEFDVRSGAFHSLSGMSAQECVSYTLKKMKQNKKVIIPTFQMKSAIFFSRFIPSSILISMTAHQQKKKNKWVECSTHIFIMLF